MSQLIKYREYYPSLGKDVFIAAGSYVIGNVKVGDYSNIWYNCTIRGDVAPLAIGENTNIQDGTVIHVTRDTGPTNIGSNVTVGHKAMIHACTLEDYAFIGMGAVLLDHSKVESFGFLAAGSVLTPNKVVKTNELWAGNPAKFMRNLRQEEIDYIKKSAQNYVKLAQNYLKND